MAAQTCHFYLFNILPNTRANNLRVASNEWAALLPPPHSPSRLYTLYIPCISVQLCVQAERAEARSENVLAPGLRPVHSRTQLPLPRLFAPPSLWPPLAICALWTWWNMILLFKLTVYLPFVALLSSPRLSQLGSVKPPKKEGVRGAWWPGKLDGVEALAHSLTPSLSL